MVSDWNPEIKRRRIPGPSVRTLSLWGLGAAAVFFVLIPIFVIGLAIRGSGYLGSPFLTTVIALIGVSGMTAAVINVHISCWVGPAEIRAGYTTKRGDHQKLGQVDPRTNRVIRRAGESFLAPDEYRRRLGLIRESADREEEQLRQDGSTSPSDSLMNEGVEGNFAIVIEDATGARLADGDTVVIIRDINFNGSATVIKAGTKLQDIRLAYDRADDRVVGAKVKGKGWLRLKPTSVKKA